MKVVLSLGDHWPGHRDRIQSQSKWVTGSPSFLGSVSRGQDEGGTQSRNRICTPALHGGKECDWDDTQTQSCKDQPCPGIFRNKINNQISSSYTGMAKRWGRGVVRSKNTGWTTGRAFKAGLEAKPQSGVQGPWLGGQAPVLHQSQEHCLANVGWMSTPVHASDVNKTKFLRPRPK